MKEYFNKGGDLYEGPYEIKHGDVLELHNQEGSVIRVVALDDAVADQGCSECSFYITENCPYMEIPTSNGIRQSVKLMCARHARGEPRIVFKSIDNLLEEI